jgi:hypothetical protein
LEIRSDEGVGDQGGVLPRHGATPEDLADEDAEGQRRDAPLARAVGIGAHPTRSRTGPPPTAGHAEHTAGRRSAKSIAEHSRRLLERDTGLGAVAAAF